MRTKKDTEKRIRNVKLGVNSHANRRVFDHVVQAFDRSKAREPALRPVTIRRRIAETAITTLAAAAVILIGITLIIGYQTRHKQIEPVRVTRAARSPGDMMTAMSLNIAYRKGGLEAVEKQCDRAFSMLGLEPRRTSIRKLLHESYGEEPERNGS